MENINNGADFEQITQKAREQQDAAKAEFDKGSEAEFVKAKAQHDMHYTKGTFFNDIRFSHLKKTSDALEKLSKIYAQRLEDRKKMNEAAPSGYDAALLEYMNSIIDANAKLRDYIDACIGPNSAQFSHARRGRRADRTRNALLKSINMLDDLMYFSITDNMKDNGDELSPRTMYSHLHDICSYFDTLKYGSLSVPKNAEYENGNKIHRIEQGDREPEIIVYRKPDPNETVTTKYIDRSDVPLFSHLPVAEDVDQGSMGDCYMLSSLAAIAQQNPSLIMDAICENEPEPEQPVQGGTAAGAQNAPAKKKKNTVTVRFFNDNNEPVYVTVEKTVPYIEVKNKNGRFGGDIYAKDALWVQLIEKAYALSGLNKGNPEAAEAGTDPGKYESIDGGHSRDFLKHFLGKKALSCEKATYELYSPLNNSTNSVHGSDVSLTSMPVGNSLNYVRSEMLFASQLKAACDEHRIITASTRDSRFISLNKKAPYTVDTRYPAPVASGTTLGDAGISLGHVYAVSDVVQDPNGTIYVVLRNPHAGAGLALENGTLVKKTEEEANGYTTLDLRTFEKYFESSTVCQYDFTAAEKERMPEARDLIRCFGETVKSIDRTLRGTDSLAMKLFFQNSGKFSDFRDAASRAAAAMSSPNPDPAVIRSCMDKLITAADAYAERCTKEKTINKDSSYRTLERSRMAKVVANLKKIFEKNDMTKETSFTELCAGIKMPAPVTGYEVAAEKLKGISSLPRRMTQKMKPEERKILYKFIKDFISHDRHKELDIEKIAAMSSSDKAELFKKTENANRLCTMSAVSSCAHELIENMRRDNFEGLTPDFEKELLFKSTQFKPLVQGIQAALDDGRYRYDNIKENADYEKVASLKDNVRAAQSQLDSFERVKKEGIGSFLFPDEVSSEPILRAPVEDAPQLG